MWTEPTYCADCHEPTSLCQCAGEPVAQPDYATLKARLVVAERCIDLAARALRGEGMEDQHMAWNTASEILDAYGLADSAKEAEQLQRRVNAAEQDATRWRYAYKMPAGVFFDLVVRAQKGFPGGLNALIDNLMRSADSAPTAHGPEWAEARRQQGYVDRSDEIEQQLTDSAIGEKP